MVDGCTTGSHGAKFANALTGMIGGHLRAVNQGLWNGANASAGRPAGCGAEILTVSPAFDPGNHNTSIALLKLSIVSGDSAGNTSYFRATVDQECSALQSLVKLGGVDAGGEFYAALDANAQRWDSFVERGSQLQVSGFRRAYRETPHYNLPVRIYTLT
jgi:hypothetical protein